MADLERCGSRQAVVNVPERVLLDVFGGKRQGLLRNSEAGANVSVEGYRPAPGANDDVYTEWVSPGFFRTLGAPLRAGGSYAPNGSSVRAAST